MANTLYDLLEVSQNASSEAITAAYQRLQAKLAASAADGDEDATNRMIALREAWFTLSNTHRRQRYDDSLNARSLPPEAASIDIKPYFLVVLLLLGLGYFGIQHKKQLAEQETLRIQAEQASATARLAEIEAREAEQARRLADQAEARQRQQQLIERANREREIAYGNQVSRSIERAESEARWTKQREEQQKAQAERQRQYEAENQLAREKAYLRQIEAEKRNSYYRLQIVDRESAGSDV